MQFAAAVAVAAAKEEKVSSCNGLKACRCSVTNNTITYCSENVERM